MTELQKILIYVVCWLIAASIEAIFMIKLKSKNTKQSKIIDLARILQSIPSIIEEAERFVGKGNGQIKLNYVMNKLHMMCIEKDIEYNEEGLTYEVEKILDTPQKKEKQNNEKTENA